MALLRAKSHSGGNGRQYSVLNDCGRHKSDHRPVLLQLISVGKPRQGIKKQQSQSPLRKSARLEDIQRQQSEHKSGTLERTTPSTSAGNGVGDKVCLEPPLDFNTIDLLKTDLIEGPTTATRTYDIN